MTRADVSRLRLVTWVGTLCASLLGLAGCVTYTDATYQVELNVAANHPDLALQALERQSKFSRDTVLYQLNRAMLLRQTGDYAGSNASFEIAKREIDKRSAISLTEQAGSLVVSEALKSYAGEDFERALIHLYAALNYLQLGERDSARVEALQVDLFLSELAKKKSDTPHIYREDAFCRYLAGMIYEELGEWSDALISYRKAYEAYEKYAVTFGVETPSFLKEDLVRLTDRVGITDEHKKYVEEFKLGDWQTVAQRQEMGEVVVVVHNGLAPIKRSRVARVIDPGSGQLISIALPDYQDRYDPVHKIVVDIDGRSVAAEPAQNINAIAHRTLEMRLPALTAKAIARAVVKYNLTRQAQHNQGDLAGFITNVAGALTEIADTRSWITLPQTIYIARVPIAAGNHHAAVKLYGAGGTLLESRAFSPVDVRTGRKTYLEHHWVSSQSLRTRPLR